MIYDLLYGTVGKQVNWARSGFSFPLSLNTLPRWHDTLFLTFYFFLSLSDLIRRVDITLDAVSIRMFGQIQRKYFPLSHLVLSSLQTACARDTSKSLPCN